VYGRLFLPLLFRHRRLIAERFKPLNRQEEDRLEYEK